jgi:hypothetical protein
VRSGSGASASTGAANEDTQRIALQVYRILKQRLMLERERAGVSRSRYG